MAVNLPEEATTQTEDVAMRFRTTRHNGLLFSTNSEHFGDKLEIAVANGKIRMNVRIGDLEKVNKRDCQLSTWPLKKCK